MSLVIVLLVVLYCALTSASAYVPSARIVGGQNISIQQVPYQVSIEYRNQHLCGGSIIAPKYILTTARCPYFLSLSDLTVRAGSDVREDGGQVVNIVNYTPHPQVDAGFRTYDIAVLELESNLDLGFTIAIIDLPRSNQTWPIGTNALITGWGGPDVIQPMNLNGLTVELVDPVICQYSYPYTFDTMFCGGIVGGGEIGACTDDFGGPLQIGGVLAGVSSFGICGLLSTPGLYTNVSLFLDFIQGAIN